MISIFDSEQPAASRSKDETILLLLLPLIALMAGVLWAEEKPASDPAAKPLAKPLPEPTIPNVRIKDLAELQGIRDNQLIGNGLVIGLEGTGDSSSKLANQELANMAKRFGINILPNDVKSKNIAAVIITATLPPFARKGSRIDIQVSSAGDATSLTGGVLIQAPLAAADGRVYAVAQGALSVGGFSAGSSGGGGAKVSKNHPVVGRIPGGALVEREVPSSFITEGAVELRLRNPDFTTAQRMVEAVNAKWPGLASAADFSTVKVRLLDDLTPFGGPVGFLSVLEGVRMEPDSNARVVINERTGTIVSGGNVRLSPTAISHGNLFISVKEFLNASQPAPFSEGKTVVLPDQQTAADEEKVQVMPLCPGPTVADLAHALNALHVTPRDIMAIFQALKNAGALHAELIIM